MHCCRAGRKCLIEVDHHRLRCDVQHHGLRNVLGHTRGISHHHSHRLAGMAHPVQSEHRLRHRNIVRTMNHRANRRNASQVLRREQTSVQSARDGVTLNFTESVGGPHRHNATASERTAHKAHNRCTFGPIVGVAPLTEQQGRIFLAAQRATDPAHDGSCWRHSGHATRVIATPARDPAHNRPGT